MLKNMRPKAAGHRFCLIFLCCLLFVVIVSCEDHSSQKVQTPKTLIPFIKNKEQFRQITESSSGRLLMVEFYADWCPPCKELAPILEEIAKESKDKVDIYKVDTDKNPGLASAFRVTGIPHVVFIKNRESVFSLSGLYPKKMYLQAIGRFSQVLTDKEVGAQEGAT
jgi:thioredoxin 1